MHFKPICILLMISQLLLSSLYAQEIQKPFSVALTGQYPPFSFYSGTGELTGFDVDISGAIAEKLNRDLRIITTEWDGILAGLLTDRYDAIIGSMAITPQRAQRVLFSDPYYISGAQFFVHREDRENISGIEDMAGKKAGVVLGETFEHYLRENHPEIEVVTYRSTVDIFQDMNNRRIDAFLSDRLVGLHQIHSAEMPFVPAGELLYEEQMGIPVRKENTELNTAINMALQELQREGVLDTIHARWFGPQTTLQSSDITRETVAAMFLRGFAVTIKVAFLSLLFGLICAIPAGVLLHTEPKGWYTVVRAFTDFIRGTPVLIQLFFVYFGAPQIGISLSPVTSAVLTLTINSAAYMSEVIRSGLMSVDPGQAVAARALGLNRLQQFIHVIWPQAFRISLPPLVNSGVALLKDTALVSVISVSEIIREAQSVISVTFDPMRYYFLVAVMFFIFTYPLMRLAGRIEKNLKSRGFSV